MGNNQCHCLCIPAVPTNEMSDRRSDRACPSVPRSPARTRKRAQKPITLSTPRRRSKRDRGLNIRVSTKDPEAIQKRAVSGRAFYNGARAVCRCVVPAALSTPREKQFVAVTYEARVLLSTDRLCDRQREAPSASGGDAPRLECLCLATRLYPADGG